MDSGPETPTDFPTCSWALAHGIDMPSMLVSIEQDEGPNACRALLDAHGGRRFEVPTRQQDRETGPYGDAIRWLRQNYGFGGMDCPLGPLADRAVTLWRVYRLCRDGHSTSSIAAKLRCAQRTVTRARARLRAHGTDISQRTPT